MTDTRDAVIGKIYQLSATMRAMSELDMGDLTAAEAACFHTACDALENLMHAFGAKEEDNT